MDKCERVKDKDGNVVIKIENPEADKEQSDVKVLSKL